VTTPSGKQVLIDRRARSQAGAERRRAAHAVLGPRAGPGRANPPGRRSLAGTDRRTGAIPGGPGDGGEDLSPASRLRGDRPPRRGEGSPTPGVSEGSGEGSSSPGLAEGGGEKARSSYERWRQVIQERGVPVVAGQAGTRLLLGDGVWVDVLNRRGRCLGHAGQ